MHWELLVEFSYNLSYFIRLLSILLTVLISSYLLYTKSTHSEDIEEIEIIYYPLQYDSYKNL